MKAAKKIQTNRFSEIDRLIKELNDHLHELNIALTVYRVGNSLYCKKTLPPRPGSKKDYAHQQTISLGLKASREGVKQAEKDMHMLDTMLSKRAFNWKAWEQYLDDSCRNRRVKQTTLIGKQIENFRKYFVSLPQKGRIPREKAWNTQHMIYFNKLPADQRLTDQIVLDAISQKTEENSCSRQKFCSKLKEFFKFLDYETKLDLTALGKGYKLPPLTGDELPTDEEILAALDLIPDPKWRTAYMLQAVFGLRNHEIFFLNRDTIDSVKDITVLTVSDETKTKFHPVAALYPEWFDDPEWQLRTAELPKIELDLEKTTLAEIGGKVTNKFKQYKIPFTPYMLRHAWARRAMEFGFTDETAAEFMGHTPEIHREHYHRLIPNKHRHRIIQSYLNNPDRPKPPQRKKGPDISL